MRSRRLWVVVAVVIALVAGDALTGAGARGLSVVRTLVVEALAPFTAAASAVAGAVRSADASVSQLVRLRAQNLRLQSQVTTAAQEQAAYAEVLQENARLRALLGLKASLASQLPYPAGAVAARVIARSPTDWFDSVLLDKGGADGVKVGMIAMAPSGLVGRISAVTPHTASVRLLTNPDSAVGAMVQRAASRDAGVVQGVLASSQLATQFFTTNPDVRVGDLMITSGLGGLFPKGLPIGRVVSVSPRRYGEVRTAEVAPAVDLSNLEEVLLVAAPPPR